MQYKNDTSDLKQRLVETYHKMSLTKLLIDGKSGYVHA